MHGCRIPGVHVVEDLQKRMTITEKDQRIFSREKYTIGGYIEVAQDDFVGIRGNMNLGMYSSKWV